MVVTVKYKNDKDIGESNIMIRKVKSLLTEYGVKWTFNRSLYSLKLRMMSLVPASEKIFERDVEVKKIDIFDFNVDLIRDSLMGLSEDKKNEIVSIADKAIDGVITGFSSIELDYGNPINWHLNPLTGAETDRSAKWYKIADFDSELGDIKVVWEASRLTHFFYFVRAYLLTDDKKYYGAFSEQLENWLKENSYSYGANYKCGQEATLRMVNALMAYAIFRDCGLTTVEDEEHIGKLVEGSYKKLISNFFYAHKCIRNNHTFSEILGLMVGSWCCEDQSALKKAYMLMDREIRNQFLSDGGFTQYSFNYQRFTLQILECLYKISRKTGLNINENDRIRKSALLMYQLQAGNGDLPNYGSNDGALIFPVTSCTYRDFRPVLNTIYAFVEGKRLYDLGDYDEELIWFYGDAKLPIENIDRISFSYNDSGIYKIGHKDGFIMTYLQEYKSRPAHMDQLHIDLWHKGINIFCDLGSYSYASDLGNELSLTGSHNTVKIKDIEQMNKSGPFLITNWTRRKEVKYTDQSFIGTMVSQNAYEHTRFIERTDLGYNILDKVVGHRGQCKFYFHTPCKVELTSKGFDLYSDNKLICSVSTDGMIKIEKAYRSLYYLKKEEINKLCLIYESTRDNRIEAKFEIRLN